MSIHQPTTTPSDIPKPWHTHGIEKLKQKYFSISEVSKIFDVEEHTLRYWERETKLSPKRSKSSNARMYDHADLELIERIYYLVVLKGLTLSSAAERLDHPVVSADVEVLNRLTVVRQRLQILRERIMTMSDETISETK